MHIFRLLYTQTHIHNGTCSTQIFSCIHFHYLLVTVVETSDNYMGYVICYSNKPSTASRTATNAVIAASWTTDNSCRHFNMNFLRWKIRNLDFIVAWHKKKKNNINTKITKACSSNKYKILVCWTEIYLNKVFLLIIYNGLFKSFSQVIKS